MSKEEKKENETQKRLENYNRQRTDMLAQGYTEHIGTISILKANLLALVTAGPFALLFLFLYILVWGEISFRIAPAVNLLFLAGLFISIPVHEFLHGLTWHFFCKDKWKSIHFGMMWKSLTPYCHCKEPIDYSGYLLGGLMPFFILGVLLCTAGILFHSSFWTLLGAYNILCAGGDTTIACMLIKYRGHRILDHPTDCGFVAFRPSSPAD